ncbi:MAG: hypothetical protein AAB529_01035 [Patescibacteria group bacterium]
MVKTLLITRPKHDITTRYLFYWSHELIDLAKEKGFSVLDLDDKRANAKEFNSMVRKHEPSFVFINGHGDENVVCGQDNEILVEADKNEEIFSSKIIYALSCKSAKILGRKSIEKGALVYIGYEDDFIFFRDNERISRPLEDKTAALFLEPSNQLVRSMLKGHSAEDSFNRSKNKFYENIKSLLSSESSDNFLVPWLLWDLKNQVCLGKKDAIL